VLVMVGEALRMRASQPRELERLIA
jgi:hypothetical protein